MKGDNNGKLHLLLEHLYLKKCQTQSMSKSKRPVHNVIHVFDWISIYVVVFNTICNNMSKKQIWGGKIM